MFSLQHVVWLLISLVIATGALILYEKKRPPLERMLTFALFLSIISEICQILSTMVLVPSATSGEMTPYLPLGQLPLHLCYVQMFFIAYARLTKRRDRREYALAFMYPTCISGAVAALLLPNVFRQVAPERSFFSPLCYRFFLYHTMLFVLGVIIVRSGEIRWKKRHFTVSLLLLACMGVATLYLNSLFSSPTYRDGELVSVDYATNFFYTYKNPLGISFRAIWQWRLYMLGYAAFAILVLFLFYYPLAFYKKRANAARGDAPQNENTDAPCPAQNAER